MTHLTGQLRRATWGRAALLCGALLVLAASFAVAAASAAQGVGLDPGYGHGGVVKVTSPGAPQTSSDEGTPSAYLIVTSFAPAADGSTYALGHENECTPTFACTESTFVERYEIDGSRDESYGDGNAVLLPEEVGWSSVLAGADGDAVVIGEVGKEIEISRYTADGALDTGFGNGGIVQLPCGCGEAQLHLLNESRGRLLVDEDRPIRFYELGTRVRLTRLDADGTVDRSFGTAGTTRFTVHGAGEPRAVVRAAGDTTLIGASGHKGCCGPRRIWLWRVAGGGKVDAGFSRRATRSLRRVSALNRYPTLASIVPQPGGKVAAVGATSKYGLGFYLRLRADGRLAAGFGSRGLLRLPFEVDTAVGAPGGAVFAIGARRSGGYRAFRILAGGRLDPAFGGARGIAAPLSGIRLHATSLGDGRVVVTDNGNSFCRSACTSRPAIARFLE